MKQKAYARAGVDIDLGNQVKATLPQLLASTHRREVLGKVGGFGGLFALDVRRYKQPVLVSRVDGVGTKLKIAFAMDYLGTGKLEPHVFTEIIKGFVRGCAENNCALIGGETAQMPGFYQPGEYDVSGTIVGVVEKSRMLNGQKTVKRGDVLIGIESSGLHTNGYSLARQIFFERLKLKPTSRLAELGNTLGDELLKVHVSYGPLVQKLIKRFNSIHDSRFTIHAFAHITGGGFVDNIPRVLPKNCDALIRKGSWDMLPIFKIIGQRGGVPDEELYQVFNMGIGMVAIVSADEAQAVLKFIRAQRPKAWMIGEGMKG